MNSRRTFFSTIATAVAGFTILPPATTYARIWKASRTTDFYVNHAYSTEFYGLRIDGYTLRFDNPSVNDLVVAEPINDLAEPLLGQPRSRFAPCGRWHNGFEVFTFA